MNPTRNWMIDLETLGTSAQACILSIGAVCLETDQNFYCEISPDQGREVDASTLVFWAKQGNMPIHGTLHLQDGLVDFCRALDEFTEDFKSYEVIAWANGTDFDISIIKDALKQCGFGTPWRYNNVRDYRTLAKLFPQIQRPTFVGEKHNALADAINQAEHLKLLLAHVASMQAPVITGDKA